MINNNYMCNYVNFCLWSLQKNIKPETSERPVLFQGHLYFFGHFSNCLNLNLIL